MIGVAIALLTCLPAALGCAHEFEDRRNAPREPLQLVAQGEYVAAFRNAFAPFSHWDTSRLARGAWKVAVGTLNGTSIEMRSGFADAGRIERDASGHCVVRWNGGAVWEALDGGAAPYDSYDDTDPIAFLYAQGGAARWAGRA